jgi:hypothetical protein
MIEDRTKLLPLDVPRIAAYIALTLDRIDAGLGYPWWVGRTSLIRKNRQPAHRTSHPNVGSLTLTEHV